MVVITFKSGVTQIYKQDSPKLISLWRNVENIASVVYGEYMDGEDTSTEDETNNDVIEEIKQTLGDFIAAERAKANITQVSLIQALNDDGVCLKNRSKRSGLYSKNFISKIEHDKLYPSLLEFQCVLEALGLDSTSKQIVNTFYDEMGKIKR